MKKLIALAACGLLLATSSVRADRADDAARYTEQLKKSKDAKTILQLNSAQANLNTILMDGSMGVHNSRVSTKGTVSPQGGIADCLRLANIWVELACRQPGANCTGPI